MRLNALLEKADLPLEVVILLVSGISLLVSGGLLFLISLGVIPYYKNGLYGLFLVLFALQMVMLGKSPFGDFRQSKFLFAAGLLMAAVGIVSSFIPDILNAVQRIVLAICFGAGGFVLFWQMILRKDQYQAWMDYGGIFRQLIVACAVVYSLSMLLGVMIWKDSFFWAPADSIVIMLFGMATAHLAKVLWKIDRAYPGSQPLMPGAVALSTEQLMMLLVSLFMILLGLLLVPVSLDLLPFSGSAQLGLLMVLFAIQMLAFGNTPVGPFQRSWLMIAFGALFTVLGSVSCMVPNVMVPFLTVLIGTLNGAGGIIVLAKYAVSYKNQPALAQQAGSAICSKILWVQLLMSLLSILFGASMLFSNLIPALLVGLILSANGLVLLYLLQLLVRLNKWQQSPAAI